MTIQANSSQVGKKRVLYESQNHASLQDKERAKKRNLFKRIGAKTSLIATLKTEKTNTVLTPYFKTQKRKTGDLNCRLPGNKSKNQKNLENRKKGLQTPRYFQ